MAQYILPGLVAFFGLVTFIVGSIFAARSTIVKATITDQKTHIEQQGSRITFLEAENKLLKDRVDALEQTKNELFDQVKSMPAFATMAGEMVAMGQKMEKVLDALVRLADRMEAR